MVAFMRNPFVERCGQDTEGGPPCLRRPGERWWEGGEWRREGRASLANQTQDGFRFAMAAKPPQHLSFANRSTPICERFTHPCWGAPQKHSFPVATPPAWPPADME